MFSSVLFVFAFVVFPVAVFVVPVVFPVVFFPLVELVFVVFPVAVFVAFVLVTVFFGFSSGFLCIVHVSSIFSFPVFEDAPTAFHNPNFSFGTVPKEKLGLWKAEGAS